MSPISMQRAEMTSRATLALIDALNCGAFEKATEWIASDCALTSPDPPPLGRSCQGREAVLQYLKALCDCFRLNIEEIINLGHRGVVRLRFIKRKCERKQEPLAGVMLIKMDSGVVREIDFYVKGRIDSEQIK